MLTRKWVIAIVSCIACTPIATAEHWYYVDTTSYACCNGWSQPNVQPQPGQAVRILARMIVGPQPPGPTSVRITAPNNAVLNLTGEVDPDGHEIPPGEGELIWGRNCGSPNDAGVRISWTNFDWDDRVELIWFFEQLSNLSACEPRLEAEGCISGYAVSTPDRVNWCNHYVTCDLVYAHRVGARWITLSTLASTTLESTAGTRCDVLRALAPFPAPPPGTTHLLTRINRDTNGAPLIPETDQQDNEFARRIPECHIDSLVLSRNGSAAIGYSVSELEAAFPAVGRVPIELFYATGPNLENRVGDDLLLHQKYVDLSSDGIDDGALTDTIESPRLNDPPEGATHLIAVINQNNALPAVGVGPFFKAIELVELGIRDLRWDGKGGVSFKFDARGSIPSHARLRYRLQWVVDDGEREQLVPVFPRKRTIDLDLGQRGKRISSSRLRLPTRPEYLYNVTHLAVKIEDDAGLLNRSTSNRARLALPHSSNFELSFELADAPPAATSQTRVLLWMRKHERAILAAARRYNEDPVDDLDPRAISGAIAWEALDLPSDFAPHPWACAACSFPDCDWRPSYGPGRLDWSGQSFGSGVPFKVMTVEERGFISTPASICDRWTRVLSPQGSIEYTAAIMHLYALPWDGFFNMRNNPIPLLRYYNYLAVDYPYYITEGIQFIPARQDYMEAWFASNARSCGSAPAYVDNLLRFTRRQVPRDPYEVAVLFFTGFFPGRDDEHLEAANPAFQALALELQRDYPTRVAALALPQTCCGMDARRRALEWLQVINPVGCPPPKVILVGHSLGGDTVEAATDIPNRVYSITIDPINRGPVFEFQLFCDISAPCTDSPSYPCPSTYGLNQRDCTVVPSATVDENFLSERPTVQIVEFFGHHVAGAVETMLTGLDHSGTAGEAEGTRPWRESLRRAIERTLEH